MEIHEISGIPEHKEISFISKLFYQIIRYCNNLSTADYQSRCDLNRIY
jgi:hypothetical protein